MRPWRNWQTRMV